MKTYRIKGVALDEDTAGVVNGGDLVVDSDGPSFFRVTLGHPVNRGPDKLRISNLKNKMSESVKSQKINFSMLETKKNMFLNEDGKIYRKYFNNTSRKICKDNGQRGQNYDVPKLPRNFSRRKSKKTLVNVSLKKPEKYEIFSFVLVETSKNIFCHKYKPGGMTKIRAGAESSSLAIDDVRLGDDRAKNVDAERKHRGFFPAKIELYANSLISVIIILRGEINCHTCTSADEH